MRPLDALKIVFCLLCLSGCSVKEDRAKCPCLLRIDLKDNDTSVIEYVEIFLGTAGGGVFSEVIDNDSFGKEYEVAVPRGRVDIKAYAGADEGQWGIEGLRIPYGSDCPPVYMHCTMADADADLVSEKILLRKNHCMLTIRVRSEGEYPFSLCVEGEVDGYGPDGNPSSGPFSYVPDMQEGNVFKTFLPRQTGPSLRLNVNDGGDQIRTFALGEYIAEAGYDWETPDLEDITLTIDYSLTELRLEVSDWDYEYSFDIVM